MRFISFLFLVFLTACKNDGAIYYSEKTEKYLKELDRAELKEINTVAGIPDFIKNALEYPINDSTMANPGEEWSAGCSPKEILLSNTAKMVYDRATGDSVMQMNDVVYKYAPGRLLTYFGMGKKIALLRYYQGGIGKMDKVVIFKFKDETITDIAEPIGFPGCKDTASKKELIKYLRECNLKTTSEEL